MLEMSFSGVVSVAMHSLEGKLKGMSFAVDVKVLYCCLFTRSLAQQSVRRLTSG